MKRKEILLLVGVAVVSGLISLVVGNALFNSPSRRSAKVAKVEAIQPTLPDVRNDSAYNYIFNDRALDPTQPVTIGNNQNPRPFQ